MSPSPSQPPAPFRTRPAAREDCAAPAPSPLPRGRLAPVWLAAALAFGAVASAEAPVKAGSKAPPPPAGAARGAAASLPAASDTAAPDTAALMRRLDAFAAEMLQSKPSFLGYPVNQDTRLAEFYRWYVKSGLHEASLNNVGDPRKPEIIKLHTHDFENEVVDFFARRFGFEQSAWGFVTSSGTDGNAHGMYFGKKVLAGRSPLPPVVYVSEEAHYSVKRLADVQGLELRLVKALPMGQMDLADFKAKLDPKRPALVVIAVGTTFKGAIDDQVGIDRVLAEVRPPAVYRHVDAALFGSILAFAGPAQRDVVDARKMKFDSIAISGHKFWGLDEPMGVFVTTMAVRTSQNPFKVEYLKDAIPTITCSRSALAPLKFWWKLRFTKVETFEAQARALLELARHLHEELRVRGIPSYLNEHSNTVFFRRPSEALLTKYALAPDTSPTMGDLAHAVVMQHADRAMLDRFVAAMEADAKASPQRR